MSLGGSGIARHEGLVVFIPFSAPGDILKVEILNQKKNFAEAKIVEIVKPSPYRVSPPCEYYGKCGGCNFQHISYESQLNEKQQIVEEQLYKFLGKKHSVQKIIPSPQQWNYRNRINLKQSGGRWGYFAKASHDLVAIDKCLIAEEQINDLIKNTPPNNEKNHLFSVDNEDLGAFSQVNTLQNKQLIDYVIKLSKQDHYEEIYDLYAGSGNFTFPLMRQHSKSKIFAVELSASSVKQAQAFIKKENLSSKKVQYFLSDVGIFLKRTLFDRSSLILLDPPRSGCQVEVIHNISRQSFKRLIYISCNPSTLGRDLKTLFDQTPQPLKISTIQPFDMFPQTDHIEVVVELVIDSQ